MVLYKLSGIIKSNKKTYYPDDNKTLKTAIDAAVFWHAARLLGKEINDNLETLHNETIPVGEGIVVRGMKSCGVMHPPFKVTGEFIIGGLLSDF